MRAWRVCLLPILYLFPYFIKPFQNKTVEAAAAPMLFYWGLWGTGGKGLFIQVFFKDKQNQGDQPQLDLGTVLGQRRPHSAGYNTEFSGP